MVYFSTFNKTIKTNKIICKCFSGDSICRNLIKLKTKKS